MMISKEELKIEIEQARQKLNSSIDAKENYEAIYQNSTMLDNLIEKYIVSGF